jgi:hypothetical protein
MSDKCQILKPNKVKDNQESLGKKSPQKKTEKKQAERGKKPKKGDWSPVLKETEHQSREWCPLGGSGGAPVS